MKGCANSGSLPFQFFQTTLSGEDGEILPKLIQLGKLAFILLPKVYANHF